MKAKRNRLRILFALMLLAGCASVRPIQEQQVKETIREIVHDSLIVIPPDSAAVFALFECDSLNQVFMKEINVLKGRKVTPNVIFKNQMLTVTMPVDSQLVFLSWKEQHKESEQVVTITKTEIVKVKPVWLKVFSVIGMGAILLFVGVIILKLK